MGKYTIKLDPDSSKLCTPILHGDKYSYLWLPIGIAGSPDIFHDKTSELKVVLEFIRAYIDDLLWKTKASLNDHLDRLKMVLTRLWDVGLQVNAHQLSFCVIEMKYLGYILTPTDKDNSQRN